MLLRHALHSGKYAAHDCDGVSIKDVAMAKAMADAAAAGQAAFGADPMEPRDMAEASTPVIGKAFLE